MATRLNWTNVAAPNFSGVTDALRLQGTLFNNATENLGKAVAGFDADQTHLADQALYREMLKFQNPAEAQAAMASGAAFGGVNPAQVSSRALLEFNRNLDTLQTREKAGYDFDRTVQANQRADNAVAAAMSVATPGTTAMGRQAGLRQAVSDPRTLLAAMGQLESINKIPFLAPAAEPPLPPTGALLAGASVPAGGMPAPMPTVPPASPGSRQAVTPTVPSAVNEALAAAAGTRDGRPEDVVLGFGDFGRPDRPISTMPVKDVMAFGRDVLIPATRGNKQLGLPPTKGSSAVGAFQITQETLQDYGKKALGENWENQPFTLENQEKVAKTLFEARKGGNLKATWASLPDATPGAYANLSWEQVRPLIAKGEVGNDLSDAAPTADTGFVPVSSASAASDLTAQLKASYTAARGSRNATKVEGERWTKAMADDSSSPDKVVDQLITDKQLPADDRRWAVREIRTMVDASKASGRPLTAAAAGLILPKVTKNGPGGLVTQAIDRAANFFGLTPDTSSTNSQVDLVAMQAAVNRLTSGGGLTDAADDAFTDKAIARLDEYQQYLTQAEAALAQAAAQARYYPGNEKAIMAGPRKAHADALQLYNGLVAQLKQAEATRKTSFSQTGNQSSGERVRLTPEAALRVMAGEAGSVKPVASRVGTVLSNALSRSDPTSPQQSVDLPDNPSGLATREFRRQVRQQAFERTNRQQVVSNRDRTERASEAQDQFRSDLQRMSPMDVVMKYDTPEMRQRLSREQLLELNRLYGQIR